MGDTAAVHAIHWPAVAEAAADGFVGSVLHAQGQASLANPARHKPTPWAAADLDRWEPGLRAALKEEGLTFDMVRQGVALGHFQVWSLGNAIMLSEAILSPRMRTLHVFAAAGDLAEIRELIPAIEEFARRVGCNCAGASGRKGWLRVLKPFGFNPPRLNVVEKEIK